MSLAATRPDVGEGPIISQEEVHANFNYHKGFSELADAVIEWGPDSNLLNELVHTEENEE